MESIPVAFDRKAFLHTLDDRIDSIALDLPLTG
jgi:hypothetical protein